MSTARRRGDHLDEESRALLRALLLCSIVEHRCMTGSSSDAAEVRAAELAVKKLETDTYGMCAGCAMPISLELLLSMPQANRCGECGGSELRRHHRRWWPPTLERRSAIRT